MWLATLPCDVLLAEARLVAGDAALVAAALAGGADQHIKYHETASKQNDFIWNKLSFQRASRTRFMRSSMSSIKNTSVIMENTNVPVRDAAGNPESRGAGGTLPEEEEEEVEEVEEETVEEWRKRGG